MMPCPQNCYDFTRTASTSSAFAGVLAGFAFVAIVFLLERASPGRSHSVGFRQGEDAQNRDGQVIGALVVAFAGLLIATFLYGGVTGEVRVDHRAALVTYLAGVVLAVSVVQLFVAIVWLARDHLGGSGAVFEWIGAVIAPSIAYMFVGTTAVDGIAVDSLNRRIWNQWPGRTNTALVIALIILTTGAQIARNPLARAWSSWADRESFGLRLVTGTNLALVLLGTLAMALFGERVYTRGWSTASFVAANVVLFIALLITSLVIASTRPSDHQAKPRLRS